MHCSPICCRAKRVCRRLARARVLSSAFFCSDFFLSLKPESSWSYEGGLDWTPACVPLTLSATGFHLRQKDGIDYSKYDLAKPWQATNVANFAYNGAEANVRLRLPTAQQLQLGSQPQPQPEPSIRSNKQKPKLGLVRAMLTISAPKKFFIGHSLLYVGTSLAVDWPTSGNARCRPRRSLCRS